MGLLSCIVDVRYVLLRINVRNECTRLLFMRDTLQHGSDISIALLDQHCILRDGLEVLLGGVEGFSVVGSVSKPKELLKCLDLMPVGVVLMELIFEGDDTLRNLTDWSGAYPNAKFLVLSQLPEGIYAKRVLSAGGSGYLMKSLSASMLIEGIRRVSDGEVVVSSFMAGQLLANLSKRTSRDGAYRIEQLTNRELNVLRLVGQGNATAAIATQMGISKKTVSTFKERIKAKLSLSGSLQLTEVALQYLGRFQ